ncbi:small multi-drug export protein [Alkalihalobacillus sp. LMS39]|uniref:small multi-drug export protein n=1 Tax=Alkalihalobacillus sp. LMS39 TaxID=2924032 RepID=UPI001FB2C04A|nr:small multi-drug export protein [Alkalihalobacillus sp. LMS39]UOE93701.1 small multi-drug export protein [Alkalihalobacillus sp. LMS39]
MFREMVQEFILQLNELNIVIQYLGIFLLSFIPFVESPGATAAAGVIGLPIFSSTLVSIGGNWISIMLVIIPFNAIVKKIQKRKSRKGFISKRASKARERYEKYGVPGVALIAPVVSSGHIGAFVSIAAGADKKKVVFWHVISIVIWAIVGVLLGAFLHYEIM